MKGRIPNITWLVFSLCVLKAGSTAAQETTVDIVDHAATTLRGTQSVGVCTFEGISTPEGLTDAVTQCRGAQVFAAQVALDGRLRNVVIRTGETIVSGESMSMWADEWVVERTVVHTADVALKAEVARLHLDEGTVVLERVGARADRL